jgi:predicted HTH domain antitoxin
MPFTEHSKRVALKLLESGEMRLSEIAPLAGVSRQSFYNALPHGIDLAVCRERYRKARQRHLKRLWSETWRSMLP